MRIYDFAASSSSRGTRRLTQRLSHIAVSFMIAALAMAGMAASAHAQQTERSKQKEAAEKERAELREKLTALKRSISRTEAARSSAADALAETETAISEANRSLRELAKEQSETQQRLKQLATEQAALEKTVEGQQNQLSALLRQQYIDGNEDRIKLLLSGDNPNRINRDLQYLGYLSQAQAELIGSLRANLDAVAAKRADALNANRELEEIAAEDREQKAVLDREKAQRAKLLASLSGKLDSQRREAGAVERDEKRLGGLVNKLQVLIREQQRAEAAAREKQQRELAAKRRAEAEKRRAQQAADAARKRAEPAKAAKPDVIEDDEPKVAQKDAGATVSGGGNAFTALRGRLAMPLQGELLARFGSRRSEGPPWKGLFIRAEEGADVHAVAAGRVIFADWLRGFGNLIIVDHGGQYMTIYGNNQAVLKRAGDPVKTGEVIASAGNSGGNEQSGLYFEMRHQGRAFDPLGWVTVR